MERGPGTCESHEVTNQSDPLTGHNVYRGDHVLQDALAFHLPGADEHSRDSLGALLGSADMQAHARLANIHRPELHTHDRFGRRIDSVEFHPSYHVLLETAVTAGLHAAPWVQGAGAGAHIERAATFIMFTSLHYDLRQLPVHAKRGVTMGMGMTEKQGGSDLRAITTRAEFSSDKAGEADARSLSQDLALAMQGSLLYRHPTEPVLDAFCRSRLAGRGSQVLGTLPRDVAAAPIIQRAHFV